MSDFQKVTSSFNERLKLIRLRRKKENLHFWEEFGIIPRWVKVLMALLYLLALAIAISVNLSNIHDPNNGDVFPPDLRNQPLLASVALGGVVTLVSLCVATFVFLTAYVNRDAARRGMNSALWTILILVFLPTWGLIGLIIYFLMREPLPYPCPQCNSTVTARFNFCPNCKCNLHPSCPQCKQEVAELDKFCPFCGNDLKAGGGLERVQESPSPAV
jgi:double zinc ribbon protein